LQAIFDDDWRSRALAGDAEAVRELARVALDPLHAFCFYRVGKNRDLCEEVVQETLLAAIDQLDRYDPARAHNHIFPWLTGLARNAIRRVLVHEHGTVSLEALWARMDRDLRAFYQRLAEEPVSEDLLLREETCELVNATMSQLPPHYRQSLEDKYVQGKSVRDIAGALQQSEKAVESLLSRAREAFRATFLALTRNLEAELS